MTRYTPVDLLKFVGMNAQEVYTTVLAENPELYVRYLAHNSITTLEYRSDRITVWADKDGNFDTIIQG